MNLQEYEQIKQYNYNAYCDYLRNKYGIPQSVYPSCQRSEESLFVHHIKEDIIANLSQYEQQKQYPEYQQPEYLCYCDYLEHLLLHILITENPDTKEGVGIGGIVNYLIPELKDFYNGITEPNRFFEQVIEDEDVFNLLKERFNQQSILLQHNETLFIQLLDTMQNSDRALVELGTGLGKTTTGLQYLRHNDIRGLVLGPRNIVLDSWRGNKEVDVMTYQSFMNKYKTIDFSKYGVIICDEVHHTSGQKWFEGIKYVLDNHIIKVIGLTATPKEDTKQFFNNNVCKGLSVLEGIEQDILHSFSYVSAIYDTEAVHEAFKDIADKTLLGRLDLALNQNKVQDILKRHMPNDKRKGIVFVSDESSFAAAEQLLEETFPGIPHRRLYSKQSTTENEDNRHWFIRADEGYLVSIDMISEGAHYPGVNTLIMLRKTASSIVFNQQLGRIVTLAKYKDPNAIVFDLVDNAYNIVDNETLVESLRQANKIKKETREKLKKMVSTQVIIEDYCKDVRDILRELKFSRRKGKIYQIDMKTLQILNSFNNLYKAGEAVNRDPSAIRFACIGQTKSCADFYWCYEEDYSTWFKPQDNQMARKIKCIELNKIYDTIRECAKELNLDESSISKVCRGKGKTCGGYHFCYLEDADTYILQNQIYITKKVMCVETKEVFNSIKEAAAATMASASGISNCLAGRNKTSGGYHWCLPEQYNNFTIPKIKRGIQGKKVRCIETNTIYNSLAEAGKDMKLHSSAICQCCKGTKKTAGGYHWEYCTKEGEHNE